jgi:hypothetical protein
MNLKQKGKGKAIPLQALTGPEGSRRWRIPDFKTIGTWRWQGYQPYAPAAFTPRKYSWYSFLLEAESTPESQCGREDYVNEKFNDTIGNRPRDLPVCSAVLQPLRHRVPQILFGGNTLPAQSLQFLFPTYTICICAHVTRRKRQITAGFTGPSTAVALLYGISFIFTLLRTRIRRWLLPHSKFVDPCGTRWHPTHFNLQTSTH